MRKEQVKKEVMLRLKVAGIALVPMTVALACRYGLTGFWSKYLGVVFWATFVYSLVVMLFPRLKVLYLFCISTGLCWAVEFFQITPYPAYLSSKHIILRLIFGATFSVYDLPAYAIGTAIGAVLHLGIKKLISRRAGA